MRINTDNPALYSARNQTPNLSALSSTDIETVRLSNFRPDETRFNKQKENLMSTVDLIVLILYLGVMIFIGFRAMKTVKNEEDFILGGRNVGTIFVLLSIFAS